MKSFSKIKLSIDSTIKEALMIIDSGAMQIALVVDSNNKLIGTITDGDIRRGLLNGLSLADSVESIVFRTPTVCSVNDSKEEILKVAVEKKIYQIPIVDLDGILVGIDEVDELLKPTEYSNKVVLMVGGLGTRLRPLTDKKPKPLLEVGNKPILETIISNFAKYGFKNIILCVNYKSEMIQNYFGDGSAFGVNISYTHEEKRMGTAGALSLMKNDLNEPFFVMNGDLLTNINFEHMLEFHTKDKAIATMGVREYDFQVPYGVVSVKDTSILKIEEKPVHSFFVSGGIYLLNKETLSEIPENTFYDMPTLFNKLIIAKEKVISFPIREYWLDIGRLSDYEQANSEYHGVFK
jgi:dTDP-glucose pyrophosphorylase